MRVVCLLEFVWAAGVAAMLGALLVNMSSAASASSESAPIESFIAACASSGGKAGYDGQQYVCLKGN